MTTKYVIYNQDQDKYFEADFAGWSWYDSEKGAYKFATKDEADYFINWTQTTDKCIVRPYIIGE